MRERTGSGGDLRVRLQQTLSDTFTIESELGGGGMSRVFVAEETRLGRKVVVKVLSPELAEGISVERFEREIRLAASLQHAHIVPVLTNGEVDGLPYFTMPFIEGESLRARVARGRLPIGECISILRDVARALAYAHGRDVVHRDIKPDNVMFSAGSAVVTDFGIAKALSASRTGTGSETLTQLGTSIGTPAYMAPEQAAGDPNVDARADIYAFGCTAYELLTGSSPFSGRTPQRMLAAHMAEAPRPVAELRPDTPPVLADLVMRSLAKDAAARPQTAADIARTLDSITSGTVTSAPAVLLSATSFSRALLVYAAAFVAVVILAKAAIVGIGLPEWVFPGALVVMGLGLPVVLFTAYVQRVNRRILTATPTVTPGGTSHAAQPAGTMATLAMKATPYLNWRRTARGGAIAVAAFALLVGGFMALRALGIGPAGSLLARGVIARRQELLVTDFKVTNADSSLGRVLGDATKATLAASAVITLPPAEAIGAALRRMQRPPDATLGFDIGRELALRNNIPAIVTGELDGLGAGGYIVTLRLVTTDSAKELASFRETAQDASGLIAAIDRLARNLRGRIGESLKSVQSTRSLNDATTSSLEALRKYTEGERLYELDRNYRPAIALLREAVAIDSTFAAAWRELAIVISTAGGSRAARDSAAAKAYQYRDRLGESERGMVVATYWTYAGRDRAKAVDNYEAMLRQGDSSAAANNLGLLLVGRREYARGESLYYAQERACPICFRPLYINLAIALDHQGKFATADSITAVGLSRFPDERALVRNKVSSLYIRGDTAAHRRVLDSLVEHGDSANRTWATGQLRSLALLDGSITAWRKALYQTRTDSAVATPRQRLSWATSSADTYVMSAFEGRNKDIEHNLDAALTKFDVRTLPEMDRPYFAIAGAFLPAGRVDSARAWLARYDAEVRDTALRRDQLPDRSKLLADILMSERRFADAIAEYRKSDRRPDGPVSACDICLSISLAPAFDSAGQVDSAIAHYERAIAPRAYDRLTWDPYLLAPFSERLGELYERKGDLSKAVKYYRDFIALWKGADPILQPKVAEVRSRLARLGDAPKSVPLGKP